LPHKHLHRLGYSLAIPKHLRCVVCLITSRTAANGIDLEYKDVGLTISRLTD